MFWHTQDRMINTAHRDNQLSTETTMHQRKPRMSVAQRYRASFETNKTGDTRQKLEGTFGDTSGAHVAVYEKGGAGFYWVELRHLKQKPVKGNSVTLAYTQVPGGYTWVEA